MKLLKLSTVIMTFTFVFCISDVQANVRIENIDVTLELKEAILGSWDYFVPGVEPAYSKGIMHIGKEKGVYAVNIELPGGNIPTEEVEVKGNEISFVLYVEGMRVDINVVIDGDALTGSGSTDQGAFSMTGTRKK